MEEQQKSTKRSNHQATSEQLRNEGNGKSQRDEITVLLRGMHAEQLERMEAQYAKLEERILRTVQKTVEDLQQQSGLDSPFMQHSSWSKIERPDYSLVENISSSEIEQPDSWERPVNKTAAPKEGLKGSMDAFVEVFQLDGSQTKPGTPPTTLTHSSTIAQCEHSEAQIASFQKSTQVVAQSAKNIVNIASAGAKMGKFQNIQNYTSGRARLGEVLQSGPMETAILILIIVNTIYMAWHTDWIAKFLYEPTHEVHRGIELFFTIFFCIDISLRIYVEQGTFLNGNNWRWNLLDSIVVITALTEEAMLLVQSHSSAVSSTKVVRVIRILRLIRILRFIRGASFFSELRALCIGIFQTIGSLFWALLLLVIVIFVFSVYLTQGVAYYLIEQIEEGHDDVANHELRKNYGSLLETMLSLWKAVTGGADWEAFCDPLFQISPFMGFTFVMYIAFTVCAMMNVVTGIFINKAIKAAEGDLELVILANNRDRKEHMEAVKRVFEKADTDGSGCLNKEEFIHHFNDPCVQSFFTVLELDLDGVEPEQLFMLLDFNGDQLISTNEFIYGCTSMKGSARNLDLARLSHNVNRNHAALEELIENVSTSLTHAQEHQDKNLYYLHRMMKELQTSVTSMELKNVSFTKLMQEELECKESQKTTPPQNDDTPQKTTPPDTPSMMRFHVFFGEAVKSLGFTVEWRIPTPVVGTVDQNGEADAHGICAGDLIEVVNEQSTEGLFREDLLPHLHVRPLTIELARASQEDNSIATNFI